MVNSQLIRVLIVDDHATFRNTLAQLLSLSPDIQLVGQAADGEGIVDLCAQLRPDVVLMDVVMRKVGGIEATHQIHSHFPGIKVIILSGFQHEELMDKALEAGAVNYLIKNFLLAEVANAIRAAMR
jgi:two-component system, NarL family, response regulator LiaR